MGLKTSFVAAVSNILNGTVSQVNFSSGNTGIATVSPASDTSVVYQTEATGVNIGSTNITANVIMSGLSRCSDTSAITVTLPAAWWQVIDGDVTTNGDLRSDIPSSGSLYFDVVGEGGYPGVPSYGSLNLSSTNLTNANVSAKGWLAKSSYVIANNRVYNYAFFESLIPAETTINAITSVSVAGSYFTTTGTMDPGGYYWYQYTGSLPLTISSAINLAGGRKVILLVDSPNLYLNGSINYTPGSEFFMVMVKGNINVSSLVGGSATADLQGYYSADSSFVTGMGDKQLHIKGAVAGLGGITLQRNLVGANSTTPAEIFEYSPADVFLYPSKLGVRRMSWKEVAP